MLCAASIQRAAGRIPSTCAPDSDPPDDWHIYQCRPCRTHQSLTIDPSSDGFLHKGRRPPKKAFRAGKGDWNMKRTAFVITAVVVGLSGPAFAQAGSGQQAAGTPPASQGGGNTSAA